MKLLILDGVREPRADLPHYRGTYRAHPTHCDALPEEHEINNLFSWFLNEGGELGVIKNLTKARRFAELWNTQLPEASRFEVVEVTDEGAMPETHSSLLGFDISAGHNYSLLSWGLQVPSSVKKLDWRVRDLYELLSSHYAPLLNRHGLFETGHVARACLKSMKALQGFSPNLFEAGDLEQFKITGVHRVPDVV